MKQKKVCFIIPRSGSSLNTHEAYLADFIIEVGQFLQTYTIVEKAADEGDGKNNIYCQKFSFALFRFLELLFLCAKLRFDGFDTFYVHYSYFGAICAKIITAIFGGKVFYWNCGMMWLFGKKRFLGFLLKHIVDYLVTGNEAMKKGYSKNLGVPAEKIKIMPNWIDTEKFNITDGEVLEARNKLNISAGDKIILFLHRLARRKGSRYLPYIIQKINDEISNVHFIIAGSGPDEEFLKNKLSHFSNVHLMGALPNSEVPKIMKACDVFIMPSEEEGFPRVIIEAQAAGLAYAAFDIGGTSEISPAEMREYIKNVGDVDGLVESIVKIINLSPEKKEEIKNALQTNARQYDIKNVSKILYKLIMMS